MKSDVKSKRQRPAAKRPALAKKGKPRKSPSFYDTFAPFIGMVKDGPPDLARNHTLYARGIKKWK